MRSGVRGPKPTRRELARDTRSLVRPKHEACECDALADAVVRFARAHPL